MVVFILLLVLSFFIVKPFLTVIFLGALLAYIFYPIYTRIKSKIKNEIISSFVVCLLVFLLIVVPAIFFSETLVKESYTLFILVKQKLALGLVQDCNNSLCQNINGLLSSAEIQSYIHDSVKSLTSFIIQKSSDFLVSLPFIIINLSLLFFSLYYFLKQGEMFLAGLSDYLLVRKSKYSLILGRLKEIIHGIVFGYLLVALIQGVFGALGFFLFGISSPLFWGLVMAMLALIPFLGTGLIWVPAALLLFFEGYFNNSTLLMLQGIGLFVYSFIFVASLDNLLKPMLIGGRAKIHPILVMLGIFGGIYIFGPLGVIIGPLVLSLTSVIVDTYLFDDEKEELKKE